jgi:hypothetical protein
MHTIPPIPLRICVMVKVGKMFGGATVAQTAGSTWAENRVIQTPVLWSLIDLGDVPGRAMSINSTVHEGNGVWLVLLIWMAFPFCTTDQRQRERKQISYCTPGSFSW